MKNDIVIMASNDWNGFWYQRQQFASLFAQNGHRVIYINRTLQKWPTFKHFLQRFSLKLGSETLKNDIPEGVKVITPLWLPPSKMFRVINRLLIKSNFKKINLYKPVLITYVPTYNALDMIELLDFSKVVYINVHNFNADKVMKDVLISEKKLIQISDFLFADSLFNKVRVERLSVNKKIYMSPPGVDYNLFSRAYRGNESGNRNSLFYFGGVGPHLAIDLYNALSKQIKVVFVGKVDPSIKDLLDPRIEVRPAVEKHKLPQVLYEADMIGIFYKQSPYIDGVIPAKFFECLSTGKPILVSGLKEVSKYKDVVFEVEPTLSFVMSLINDLKNRYTQLHIEKQREIAKDADWSRRFNNLYSIIMSDYQFDNNENYEIN